MEHDNARHTSHGRLAAYSIVRGKPVRPICWQVSNHRRLISYGYSPTCNTPIQYTYGILLSFLLDFTLKFRAIEGPYTFV